MAMVNIILQGFIQIIVIIKISNITQALLFQRTFPVFEKVRISEVTLNSFCIKFCLSSRLVVQLSDWLIQSLRSDDKFSLVSMLH